MQKQALFFGKTLLVSAFFSVVVPLGLAQVAVAETLRTQDYDVIVTNNCIEGAVVCDDVTYYGSNVNTGESVQLQGRTLYRLCADGVTPCQFLGYEFFNGDYRYVVTEEGRLQVFLNGEVILDQQGTWEY